MERYFTAEEVLQLPPFAHLKLSTFIGWRSEGKGPDYTKVGSKCLYRESAINRWLLEQERKLTKQEHQPADPKVVLPPSSQWRPDPKWNGSRRNKTKRERREEMQAQRSANSR